MWRVGFLFHEMAFGLLSVFLPLYVMLIGGSLFDIGVMSASALFSAIPASLFWGYICDRTRRYKRYILLSFAALALILYIISLTQTIGLLVTLYAVMWIFHVAHESPKNVLIAELYSREEWEKAFASYEFFAKTGWLSGLALGFIISTWGFDAQFTLILCSALNFAAFASSLLFVEDPQLIFERSLVKIEKTVDFTHRGIALASKLLDGISTGETLKKENPYAFCLGLILFSLATSIFTTPLPVFFSKDLAVPTNLVFILFLLNSIGGVAGYLSALKKPHEQADKAHVGKMAVSRCILTLLLAAASPQLNLALPSIILFLMGFTHALFLVYTLSISMEVIPQGKAGLFNVLVNIGGACGSFAGPFIAQTSGFTLVFLAAGALFLLAYAAFKAFK